MVKTKSKIIIKVFILTVTSNINEENEDLKNICIKVSTSIKDYNYYNT